MIDHIIHAAEAANYKSDIELNPMDGLLHCTKCGGARQIRQTIVGVEYVLPVMCECREAEVEELDRLEREKRRADRIELIRSTGIRHRSWLNSRFETDMHQESADSAFARNWADHWREAKKMNAGMYLSGTVGTGKTFYAACIANQLADQGVSVYMATFPEILAEIQKFAYPVIETILRNDLLILDDFGVNRNTDFAKEQLFALIDAWYSERRPIIITSNIPLSELRKTTDQDMQRLADRITEMCPIMRTMAGGSVREEIGRNKLRGCAQNDTD